MSDSRPAWAQYQDQAASFFRDLGLHARTNVRVDGARATHDVDVLVEFFSAGIPVTWVVECKAWKTAIPKERVLVLDGVVKDVGADRGILVAESGFQGGAVRAAAHANLTLTSLKDLRESTTEERERSRLAGYFTRIAELSGEISELWVWAPPSMQPPAVPLEKMLKLAGTSFELQTLVSPKLIKGHYPIALAAGRSLRVASDPQDLAAMMNDVLAETSTQAAELWELVTAAAESISPLVAVLEERLKNLLATGRSLGEDPAAPLAVDAAKSFVMGMRGVSDAADAVKAAAPQPVTARLSALMRRLLDETYVVLDSRRPSWDLEEAILERLLLDLRSTLSRHASRPASEVSQGQYQEP